MNGAKLCRALAADLESIHIVAADLGAEEIAPPEHIWITLRNQLEAEGIIHERSRWIRAQAWLVVCVSNARRWPGHFCPVYSSRQG